ncbi:MAG: hypothetical protein FD135_3483, partial [Comamonadaceae bacterium]
MENGFYYHVHGFTLYSEIECPELLLVTESIPDVRVQVGLLADFPLHQKHPHQGYCIEGMHMLLNIKDVGRFSVKDGREIIVDPAPDAEPKMIRLFLL